MKEPSCTCGGSICGVTVRGDVRKSRYRCVGCKRRVPWCFGAADNMPDHCDDCWKMPRLADAISQMRRTLGEM